MGRKINIGIVGLGVISDFQIAALNNLSDRFKLITLCDKNKLNRKHDVDAVFYSELSDLAKIDDLDAVVISTPNKNHYETALALIKMGKNVIVEKPATENVIQFEKLITESENHNTLLYSSYHAAFGSEVQWLKQNLARITSKYGKICAFDCLFSDPYLDSGKLLPTSKSLGGSWNDSGINAISILLDLFDEISLDKIIKTKIESLDTNDIQSTAYLSFLSQWETGKGIINTNWTLNENSKSSCLYFEDKTTSLTINHSEQTVSVKNGKSEQLLYENKSSLNRLIIHYQGVFEDFYKMANAGKDNRDISLNSLKLLYKY